MKHKISRKNISLRFLISHFPALPAGRSSLISERGAALITLLFFTLIATTVTGAAVVILLVNSLSGAKYQQGTIAYEIAQAGIENAKLRLLRNPDYTGETLTVGNGSAEITVTNDGTDYTIVSEGTIGNFMRQIQVEATYNNNLLVITSSEEVF